MKKILLSILTSIGLLGLASCSDFTDIKPKGSNLLQSVTDLEMLLNYEYSGIKASQVQLMAGDLYPMENIPTVISLPQTSLTKILTMWDETAHSREQIEQTSSDSHYTQFYYIIGRIANPILMNIDGATGDETLRRQVKCEALVLRAYFHYLLVQKFARAYDPSYASTTLAIPYLYETQDLLETIPQLTLQEVYTNILEDLDLAISLGGLPEEPVNHMRMGLPFAYAVKAMALMSMQRFDDAADAAESSLAINPTISNYNDLMVIQKGMLLKQDWPVVRRPFMDCPEDLFVTRDILDNTGLSAEAQARFEDGHICRDRIITDLVMFDYMMGRGEDLLGLDIPITYDFSPNWNSFGLKTAHMRLVLAECELHKGNIDNAMEQLDLLRVNRIITEKYSPLKGRVTTKDEAIRCLKQTSHGENIYSYYNFVNRKRWNQLDDYKETLTRTVGDNVYTVSPESTMWIFPFPQNVISLNPSIQQNY